MYFVYSTATNSIAYTLYEKNASREFAVAQKKSDGKRFVVVINGGHGVANKFVVTPKGVVTQVSDEDMDMLLNDVSFQRHLKAGFMCYDKKEVSPEKMAENMTQKDGSAPITDEDFKTGEYATDENKIYKSKKGKAIL
jgi:hypothetical protein